MNLRLRPVFAWIGLLWLVRSAGAGHPPFPNHLSFSAGDTFAFLGDQITSEGSYAQFLENFFLTRYPERPAVFLHAGCANDTVRDALDRLEPDVLGRGVNYAFLLFGSWDGGFVQFSEPLFRAFQDHYAELLDRLAAARIHPFLLSPPMFDQLAREQRLPDDSFPFRNWPVSPHYNGVMALYGTWLREEAVRRNLRFIDIWGPLNACTTAERRINSSFSLVPDSLQPDPGGHTIIASAIIESLALERDSLGQITLEYTAEPPSWRLRSSEGGLLSQLQGDAGGLSFLWKAKSLPWAFPDSAMLAVQLARIDERHNREILHVIGLKPGEYELSIAGERMPGSHSHVELARGLELHHLPERPDYAQSLRLAGANRERHAEWVRPQRELWESLKRTRQGYPGDNARYLQTHAELKPRMEALRQQARERLKTLYQEAKPATRSFEIRRILTPAELKAQTQSQPPPAEAPPPANESE